MKFLMPTRIKLAFLLEWTLYSLFVALRGQIHSGAQLAALAFPLLLFYFAAAGLAAALQGRSQIAGPKKLLAASLLLAALDQGIKQAAAAWLPLDQSFPLVPGLLYLRRTHNLYVSWLMAEFDRRFLSMGATIAMTLIFMALMLLASQYYRATKRRSAWADLALLLLFAGFTSALADQALRGYTIDYIQVPGFVVADLKDLYLSFGIGAVLAETLDNPAVSWHPDPKESLAGLGDFARFSARQIRRLFRGGRG